MRKGLKGTLMAVAIVLMAVQAMANAPVIEDMPNIVVGNSEQDTTPDIGFVYPDAIDLTMYGTDQESDSTDLIWSYYIEGDAKYRINDTDKLADADLEDTDTLLAPPFAKRINNSTDANDGDNKPLTITVSNVYISGDTTDTTGILDSQTQAVTLFLSDGTSYTSTDILLYTDSEGKDRLSPGPTDAFQWPPFGQARTQDGFFSSATGNVTLSFDADNGLCITTVQDDEADVLGVWKSPYGAGEGEADEDTLVLVKNAVYHIQVVITSDQSEVTEVPYWDLTVNNFEVLPRGEEGASTYYGQNGYGANFFFLSNVGGANAAVETGGTQYNFWWCPSPISVDRWNDEEADDFGSGPFGPGMEDNKNAFVEFRILQSASNEGTNGKDSNGTLCLKNLFIERYDLDAMRGYDDTLYDTGDTVNDEEAEGITNSDPAIGGNTRISTPYAESNNQTFTQFTFDYTVGKALTIQPADHGSGPADPDDAGKGSFIALVEPGDTVIDYGNEGSMTDNYPCQMDNETLYLVTFDLSAPQANDENRPPAVMWVGADSLTNELICLSYVTLNFAHHGMPPFVPSDDDENVAVPQEYKAFFYSNYGTVNNNDGDFSWWARFRPRFMLGNNTTLGPSEPKSGAIRIHRMRVERVGFQS